MMLLAPGRLSRTSGCPSALLNAGCRVRARLSAPPPGENGMMMRTGFDGYAAEASAAVAADAHAPSISAPHDNSRDIRLPRTATVRIIERYPRIAREPERSALPGGTRTFSIATLRLPEKPDASIFSHARAYR